MIEWRGQTVAYSDRHGHRPCWWLPPLFGKKRLQRSPKSKSSALCYIDLVSFSAENNADIV